MGGDTMGGYSMKRARRHTKGFTLIASLLMMLMLSGMAIGLMMMVNTEGKVGGDRSAEQPGLSRRRGWHRANVLQPERVAPKRAVPSAAQICGVAANNGPSMLGVTWKQYSVVPGTV